MTKQEHRRCLWRRQATCCLALATVVLGACDQGGNAEPRPGCTKDIDCKGERVCVLGRCEPLAARPPAAPPPAASPAASPAATPAAASVSAAAGGAEDQVPCGSQLDTGCSADLFVQLMFVGAHVPDTYDHPDVQKILRAKPDYKGVRLVEALKNNKRILAAIARNRCQAERLAKDADAALKTGAWPLCERIEVIRTVLEVR
ncbi:MAG: hypothetical protein HY744_03080 [Deltaproteobacteria bacterium]|nr:hypothetical protein [Deltaproteobacteria bacterium]